MRNKRMNKKLLRLSDEEKNMLTNLAQFLGLDESQTIRFLIRREYEKIKS